MRMLSCLVALTWSATAVLGMPTAQAQSVGQAQQRQIEPPRLIEFVEADFPESEKERLSEASVLLQIAISETGQVADVAVLESAGAAFDAAAVAAARQFLFSPARVNGKAIPVKIDYRYEFTWTEQVEVKPTADLLGSVRDRKTKQPLSGIKVDLGEGRFAVTDSAGRFQFEELEPGEYQISISGEQMATVATSETLEAGQRIEVAYDVELRDEEDEEGDDIDFEFVITAPRIQRQVVATEISTTEGRKIPGTQGDVLKVVENMPGVARAAAGSAALVVWGAAPEDTRVYVDGLRIPRLYHDGGYRSVVHSDMVRSVELIPGGYGAMYGRGLGGIVNVRLRPLDEDGFKGSLAADVIDASAATRVKIGDRLRVSAAVRRSHLADILPLVANDDVGDVVPIPQYYDAQLRVGYELAPHETIEVGGLLSSDKINRTVSNSDPLLTSRDTRSVSFQRVYAKYEKRTDSGRVSVLPSIGWDQSSILNRFGGVSTAVENNSKVYGLRASWRGGIAENVMMEVGFDADLTSSNVTRRGAIGAPPREGDARVFGQAPADQVNADQWNTLIGSAAVYSEVDIGLLNDKLHILPGFRVEPYAVMTNKVRPPVGDMPNVNHTFQHTAIEPRLMLRYQITEAWSAKAAYGHYHQPPLAEDLSAVFGTPILELAKARHYLLGTKYQLTETLDVEMTGFFSQSSDLIWRNVAPSPFIAQALAQKGEGRSYGAQVLLRQQKLGRFFGWVSYSLMRSERRDDPSLEWRKFDYDQTHVLSAVGSYDLGNGFEVGARFRYATGFPRTPVNAAYFDAATNTYQPLFGERNSIRIPAFVSVDLRASKTFKFDEQTELEVYLDVYNTLNRRNPEELVYNPTYEQSDYINGFPILPVFGSRFSW